jgi:hypothetical protein
MAIEFRSRVAHYWVDWERPLAAPNIIRRDTRLYWQTQRQGTLARTRRALKKRLNPSIGLTWLFTLR